MPIEFIKSLQMPNINILFIKKDKYLRIAILAHDIAYILEKTRMACSIVHIGLFFIRCEKINSFPANVSPTLKPSQVAPRFE